MTTVALPAVLGQRVGERINSRRNKRRRLAAITTAKALILGGNPVLLSRKLIELKRDDDFDPTDWRDQWKDVHGYVDIAGRKRRGIAQELVGKAEFGGRAASDVYDYVARKKAANAQESARVGKFKLTENSPNTARITVGPDQRERRKKYVWERVGVQRQLAGVGAGVLLAGGALLHAKFSKAGGGNAALGAKNVIKGAFRRVQGVAARAVGGGEVAPFKPEMNPHGAEALAQKIVADRNTQRAAKNVATRLTKYGEKPVMTPQFHPEGHPDAGKPIIDPVTGRQKKKLQRRPSLPKFTPSGGQSMTG